MGTWTSDEGRVRSGKRPLGWGRLEGFVQRQE